MRKNLIALVVFLFVLLNMSSQAYADVFVKGYFRKDGTYVKPHFRSNPDGLFFNNFSTYGNINPYTGAIGTKRYPDYNYNNYNYNYNAPVSYLSLYKYFDYLNPSDYHYDRYYFPLNSNYNFNTTTYVEDYELEEDTSDQPNVNVAEDYIITLDSPDEIAVKNMIVEYFNAVNTRDYMVAYEYWGDEWQSRHPYNDFENGYVDVINHIDDIKTTYQSKGIKLEVNITAEEGWEQEEHRYNIVYNVQKINERWKMIKGKGKEIN
jgi:hypothetical protein